jgi:hypothetical protein
MQEPEYGALDHIRIWQHKAERIHWKTWSSTATIPNGHVSD